MDSVEITVFPNPAHALQISSTDEMCGDGNGSILLTITDNTFSPYLFDFNNGGYGTSTSYTNLINGNYSLEIKDNNACVFDTVIHISDNGSGDNFHIANCFSPNNDGANDVWFIPAFCDETISCKILNRWGVEAAIIHENQSWNGKINDNEDASDGVYYYIAEIEFTSGVKKTFTGFISLLR